MSTNPITRSRASLALHGSSTPQPTSSTPSASLVPPPATEPAKPKVYNYHPSHPAAPSTPASTSNAPALSFTTPAPLAHGVLGTPVSVTRKKVYGMNARSVGRPQPKFKAPLKAGLAPGEPGGLELERKAVEKTKIALANVLKATPVKAQTAMVEAKKSRQVAFNLSASCASLRDGRLIGPSSTYQWSHQIVEIYVSTLHLNGTIVSSWPDLGCE